MARAGIGAAGQASRGVLTDGRMVHADLENGQPGTRRRPSVAKAAYRAGERLTDERTGIVHDYERRGGVLASGIEAKGNAPDWAKVRAKLWNAVEAKENRKNSVVARELMVPLPSQVPPEERERVAREIARSLADRHGSAVDWSLHAPSRDGDERNFHVHLLMTTRTLGADGWGDKIRVLDESIKKDADGKSAGGKEVEAIREELAAIINRSLERHGIEERVDHRSYERRGMDREAEPHMGTAATAMERRGERTEKGDERRAVQERNRDREEAEIINLELARIERQEREERRAAKIEQAKAAHASTKGAKIEARRQASQAGSAPLRPSGSPSWAKLEARHREAQAQRDETWERFRQDRAEGKRALAESYQHAIERVWNPEPPRSR